MKTLITTILILSSLVGYGQSGTLQTNKFFSTGVSGTLKIDSTTILSHFYPDNSKPFRDTIPVFIVFAESPSKITVSAVKYMVGFSIREMSEYYQITPKLSGFSSSVYAPVPLMVNVKYLDGNKIDIPDTIHVLMSKEIK